MKKLFLLSIFAILFWPQALVKAQIRPTGYLANAHSHNDYTRNHPFKLAYGLGFGSIEVDLFLRDGELYVAHEVHEITSHRTFDKLYLEPILQAFADSEDGYLYPGKGQLQLLIDPKTEGGAILELLTEKLKPYRDLFDSRHRPEAVKLVISGRRPRAEDFHRYDDIFYFDGSLGENYSPEQLDRIGLFSAPFPALSEWNGLGRLTAPDLYHVRSAVDSVHRLGKKIRFWAAPDTRTTWYEWIKIGIDYINTDRPMELASFLQKYEQDSYQATAAYRPYQPNNDFKLGAKPKNILLLISDGAGMSQLWAAAIANRGRLNVLNMPYTGYLFTGSLDNYHTDSAAGGSALATGVKTRNRYIGVDSSGHAVPNIPERIHEIGMLSGIVSNDRVTGATPSSFYTHVQERNQTDQIALDLVESKLSLVIGGFHPVLAREDSLLIKNLRQKGFEIRHGIDQLNHAQKDRVITFAQDQISREWDKLDPDQQKTATNYRLIEHALEPALDFLQRRSGAKGFFLMVEGAKIDGGGHSNSMSFTVSEYLSFDRMVGQALAFADQDGETLVIVTSDHETGGLVILDGDDQTGHVLGRFATTDHTGIPVPLAAYGPGAEHFQGFIDNAEIAERILKLLGLQ